jgi:hypothetical protein
MILACENRILPRATTYEVVASERINLRSCGDQGQTHVFPANAGIRYVIG